ncbi:MAG: MarR family transcriptional regulator [Actinomycetota bacterium]|nr:MarR family transcriptional regulator [Actinomycetota bacterium]
MVTEWLSDDEQALWRRLLSVEARLQDRLDRDLRAGHGLTLGEYAVLVHVSESGPGGLRMSDLAARLLLSRSGLTRRVDSMVRAGLVERRSCPADGRGAMAQLTPLGQARLAEAAPTHVEGVRRYLLDPLADRLDGLSWGLEEVDRALGEPSGILCGGCPDEADDQVCPGPAPAG